MNRTRSQRRSQVVQVDGSLKRGTSQKPHGHHGGDQAFEALERSHEGQPQDRAGYARDRRRNGHYDQRTEGAHPTRSVLQEVTGRY